MTLKSIAAAFATCIAISPAQANDGFGGISATGLTFGQTEDVAMVEEDLFIGIDRISVDYLFRNKTRQDVTGEVIFPMPPIALGQILMSGWNLPEDVSRENLVNFSATVGGKDMPLNIDRIAVLEPIWEEDRPISESYDTPGKDVTALLTALDIPLSLDTDQVMAALMALPPAARKQLADQGAIEVFGEGTNPDDIFPNWSIVLRYHWTQTFPAGKDLRISHAYENYPPGGIFIWRNPPYEDWQADLQSRYCIDKGTSAAIMKRLKNSSASGEDYVTGMSYALSYVLRTANSWAGPIEKFRLTLDKGDAKNVISLCADGVQKTGPTTFVIEKENFSPADDLEILVVQPLSE